ncbi:MAG TPA: hypothetical protein VH138_02895 [Vicinamibacterales bacterium]|nr:hypothetical protein [Vicinamibacterales bacterium]
MYDARLASPQVDDMNPGIQSYPNGLFWTMALPDGSVTANPGNGKAVLQATNVEIFDFGDFPTSLSGALGTPATVSFEVRWSGADSRINIKDPASGFGGEFVRGHAQMSWSAVVGDLAFQSDPLETSSSDFATMGTERNGVFFPRA